MSTFTLGARFNALNRKDAFNKLAELFDALRDDREPPSFCCGSYFDLIKQPDVARIIRRGPPMIRL